MRVQNPLLTTLAFILSLALCLKLNSALPRPGELYARELQNLKEFNNEYLDFRIYFCTGMFLRNKENHELFFKHVVENFGDKFKEVGQSAIYKKFMAISVGDCLKYVQKYESKKFYLKIREFAEPGKAQIQIELFSAVFGFWFLIWYQGP